VIVGPTAGGKTALGVELALRLDGEIVNADAMQLYRGMDIGTAKATPAERRGVPHHLLDVLDPSQEASVAAFQRHGRAAVDEVLARGRAAIVVGGSGLYVRALLDDLTFPGTDPGVRARLESELAAVGAPALHARLAQVDAAAAAALLPTNGRRIVRALEVIEITGQPFTATLPPYGAARWGAVQLGIDPPAEVLDARIADRVARMWEDGIVIEAAALAAADGGLSRTAARALGYAQALAQIGGSLTEQQAREDTITATRRLARRQLSWFRRDPRVRWLAHPATATSALTALG
jgi:tRNA dimethylallyltransferase